MSRPQVQPGESGKTSPTGNLMICLSAIWQAEPRMLKIGDRILVERDNKSSQALLKEGSAPGDGEWAVAASPDRKRDRAEQAWG